MVRQLQDAQSRNRIRALRILPESTLTITLRPLPCMRTRLTAAEGAAIIIITVAEEGMEEIVVEVEDGVEEIAVGLLGEEGTAEGEVVETAEEADAEGVE